MEDLDKKLMEDLKVKMTDYAVSVICEMRMAPDQSGYPLTRRQVEKMLAQRERREDEDNWNDDPEYRSPSGWQRTSWYPPELDNDYSSEDVDSEGNQRPAKLMPYDFFYTNYKVGEKSIEPAGISSDDDDTEDEKKPNNWAGATNAWQ